jgi:phosphoribosylanthranilate isomerase
MGHVRIKICGITRPEDAHDAAALGADAVGLNFYPLSPRCVDPAAVATILSQLPPFMEAVGVFVNKSIAEMIKSVEPLGRVHTLQWHGDHAQREVYAARPYRLIQAFAIRDETGLREVTHYLDLCRQHGQLPDAVLLDAQAQGQYGGTGTAAPWRLLADFRPGVPIILAGGLTPGNVAEAIQIVKPYAVDVASGVEESPGRKALEKMRSFIANAREAAARYL